MKFTNITIQNYRSIKELTLDLSEKGSSFCHILAGINESGKSNILRALSLLAKNSTVEYGNDINKQAEGEIIRIQCKIDPDATAELKDYIKVKQKEDFNLEQLDVDTIEYIKEFNPAGTKEYFSVRLKQIPKGIYTYSKDRGFILQTPRQKNDSDEQDTPPETENDNIGDENNDSNPEGEENVSNDILEYQEDWEKVLAEELIPKALSSGNLPKVIFWKYSTKYLIDQPINLEKFSENISSSKPLYNIFRIAGYTTNEGIKQAIKNALGNSAKMGELTDKLAKHTRKYFEKVWPEHKVWIEVHPDKPDIEFHVKDGSDGRGRYNIGQRSDGFKHFLAILLNLAAENLSEELKNALILLDEPELHLHPSGARFLRDELINIARNNTLLYSTHSVFMIDTTCLERHYKIEKTEEFTEAHPINADTPYQEELIYEALGTSIFTLIKEHNLLVEGSTDKKLIEAFTAKFTHKIKPLDIKIMHVGGESHFDKYLRFFNEKSIKGYVLCDSDSAGRKAKERIIREYDKYTETNTFELDDFVQSPDKDSSIEDLLPDDVLEGCILKLAGVQIELSATKPLKDQIDKYNKKNSDKPIHHLELKSHICDFVCNDIARTRTLKSVEEKYKVFHEFVSNLHKKLKESS